MIDYVGPIKGTLDKFFMVDVMCQYMDLVTDYVGPIKGTLDEFFIVDVMWVQIFTYSTHEGDMRV